MDGSRRRMYLLALGALGAALLVAALRRPAPPTAYRTIGPARLPSAAAAGGPAG